MIDKKIHDRIRKCLDLGRSTNHHEAAQAIRTAQTLMKKYNLTNLDIDASAIAEHLSSETTAQKPKNYINTLMHVIDHAFGVESIYSNIFNHKTNKSKKHIIFIGEASASDLAAYAFDVCMVSLKIARRNFMKSVHKNCKTKTKEARGDAFCEGFVKGISNNIQRISITDRTLHAIEHYKEINYPLMRTIKLVDTSRKVSSKERQNAHISAKLSGFSEGIQVPIHRPINGNESVKINSPAHHTK